MEMRQVVREALELPQAERARLVDQLMVSLGMVEGLEELWEETWDWEGIPDDVGAAAAEEPDYPPYCSW